MPAGEYTVSCTSSSSDIKVLRLRSIDGHESTLIRTSNVRGKISDDAKLVFSVYGNQYFLAQVWLPADSNGMQAPKSRTESQLARELATTKSAKEMVGVVAKL